jgi:hypothetical protein
MSVEICSVQRLVLLKRARNAFIHELETDIDFNRYFAFAVGVVCDLEFMLVPNSRVIKEFPFEDSRSLLCGHEALPSSSQFAPIASRRPLKPAAHAGKPPGSW